MVWDQERIALMNKIKKLDFDFDEQAIRLYYLQYQFNPIYRQYVDLIKRSGTDVKTVYDIPFLPIRFFKEFEVKTGNYSPQITFLSSGTSQVSRSRHLIRDLSWYHWVSKSCFDHSFFPQSFTNFNHLGYLPSYADNPQSSLLSMLDEFIKSSGGGFFHHDQRKLIEYFEANHYKPNIIWGEIGRAHV